MANRLQNLRVVDAVLSDLAIGYSNPEYIAQELFPMAKVPKMAGKIPVFSRDHFKLYNTERALRAKSNVMQPSDRTFIDVALEEHDISVPMDYLEEGEADFDLEASNTVIGREIIALRNEKQAADLAFNAANYAAGNKITLSGPSQFTTGTSDPIGVIEAGKEVVRRRVARRPNVAVMGASTFSVLKNHPQLLERIKYTETAVLTPALMAVVFGVDKVVVGNAIWETDAGVAADIWGDSILLSYVRPPQPNARRTVYEPNFGYCVYKMNAEVDKYDAEGGKVQYVRNTMIFRNYLVGADAGYLISDTNV